MIMTGMTARELLVDTAGDAHALHTVLSKTKMHKGAITFRCSCSMICEVSATLGNITALRNVPEIAGS